MTPTITVLTPTHNRADLIGRVYDSLCTQTYRDFEWLVVDDGSTDETAEVVKQFAAAAEFPIRYLQQANGGRHRAMNNGVREAHGEFCAVIDDDDWYEPIALERLKLHWDEIPDPEHFAEVQGLCAWEDGELVGTKYPNDITDSDYFELQHVLGVIGDKVGMIRTDVLREFPFPEDDGRSYVEPRLAWNRISEHYRIRGFNEVVARKELQADGISATLVPKNVQLSDVRLMYWEELLAMRRPMPAWGQYKAYANLIRNGLHQHRSLWRQSRWVPKVTWWLAAVPAGVVLYLRDLAGG